MRQILDAEALRDLDTRVVEIGAHGLRHQRLAGLDADALRQETCVARTRLEEVCGREVTLFAYPYGQLDDVDAAAESAVRYAGFHAACSTHFGRGSSSEERFRLRRIGVATGESLREFALKLDGAYDWVAWKERVGRRARNLHHRIRKTSGSD
jgi:peptidoglycan/xylan/chitin deacetylase (PgdA/CDA1 family)